VRLTTILTGRQLACSGRLQIFLPLCPLRAFSNARFSFSSLSPVRLVHQRWSLERPYRRRTARRFSPAFSPLFLFFPLSPLVLLGSFFSPYSQAGHLTFFILAGLAECCGFDPQFSQTSQLAPIFFILTGDFFRSDVCPSGSLTISVSRSTSSPLGVSRLELRSSLFF